VQPKGSGDDTMMRRKGGLLDLKGGDGSAKMIR
jgi:hypothetical protein